MGRNKKILSLNKTILKIVLVGYLTLLILLVCMDFFLIIDYQRENAHREEQALNDYAESVTDSMGQIRKVLYDIYVYNDDFQILSRQLSDADIYSHAYDLRKTLESQMMINERLQGFYIFYGTEGIPFYKVNTEQIAPEHAGRIGQALKQTMSQDVDTKRSNWSSNIIGGNVYLSLAYEKGNVTVYGIRNLGNAQNVLKEQTGKDVEICLIDSGRELLGNKTAIKSDILKRLAGAGDKIDYSQKGSRVYGRRIPDINLWICAIYPRGFWDYMSLLHLLLIVLTVGSFLAALSIYLFLKRNLVQPLVALRDEMELIRRDGNENVSLIDMRFLELKEVNETLREMILKLERQKLLTYDEFIEKQKAQLQYLQLQMQPHFYLNGLKALNAFVLEHETEKVQELIINLSGHLRYLLQAEKEMTTLIQELQFADNYTRLRGQMTGRPIQLYIDGDSALNDWNIPMLAAQTFVENSIKYAKVGGGDSALLIEIQTNLLETENGRYLNLIVKDNGQGYGKEILDDINGQTETGKKNIGINNLKRRCQILYGGKVEFTFYNRNGAVSEMIFPEVTGKAGEKGE